MERIIRSNNDNLSGAILRWIELEYTWLAKAISQAIAIAIAIAIVIAIEAYLQQGASQFNLLCCS